MKKLMLVVLLAAPAAVEAQEAPDLKNGAAEYARCVNCHGGKGEGAWGPDLAGRGLSFEQFKKAVREPWGMMPSFPENVKSDKALRDIHAYMQSLPKAAKLGEWRFKPAPASAPVGQQLYMNVIGCGQCHEPENKFGRMWLGEHAKEVNYEYFKKQIFQHYEKWPKGTMPLYSPKKVLDPILREIYKWMVEDIGMRASVSGMISVAERQGDQTTYNIQLSNNGVKNVGIDAEGLTVFVRLPEGTKVVKATGQGYSSSMPLAKLGLDPLPALAPHAHDDTGHVERLAPDLTRDVAVWKFPKLEAGGKASLTLTLSGPAPSAELVKGFQGSSVYWEKPGRRPAGSPPIMVYRDLRSPDKGDGELITPPRLP
jgi:mono/diheme cytochrome c family protein